MDNKIKTKKILIGMLIMVAILIVFLAKLILAINTRDTGFRVINGGAIMKIDVWSECRNVNNDCGYDIFVPTKTEIEWTGFRTHSFSGVLLTACGECVNAKGCWILYPSCEPLDLNCYGGNCCYMGGAYPPPGCPQLLCPN